MLIPRGFKTRRDYLTYVKHCERALYGPHELAGHFDVDEDLTERWSRHRYWKDTGLTRIVYQGIELHEYHRPAFELFPLHIDPEQYCLPCEDDQWLMEDDVCDGSEVISYPVFLSDTLIKVDCFIGYSEDFAAKAAHP